MKPSADSPFNLDNDNAYQEWRKLKLSRANTHDKKSILKIQKTPPHFLSHHSLKVSSEVINTVFPVDQILKECDNNNYCIYRLEDSEFCDEKQSKQLVHLLAKSCGINHLDNNICADDDQLTSIYNKKTNSATKRGYIPYTDKKLSWHTDGYYNPLDKTIYSMLLHCHNEAETGGESSFIDHEIVYIMLRDEKPSWIKALNHPQAMTIPANILNDEIIRAEQTGPVFSLSPQGRLHMRYSARTKNIAWREDTDTQDAVGYLKKLLDKSSSEVNSKYIIKHKLTAGEGIITRNILHCREAYEDNETSKHQRLLFRGRFYDELPLTSMST